MKLALIDFVKKLTALDTKVGAYNNGKDNAYPERMDRLINNSATARMATKLMTNYIVGKGFVGSNEFIVHKDDELTLMDFSYSLANSLVRQRGAFVHVNYNLNYDITSMKVLPFSDCRIGKRDDNKYSGKVLVYDNWTSEHGKIDRTAIKAVDVYNPNKKVIQAQIEACKGKTVIDKLDNYKGQILYINLDRDYIYPYSTIDAVQNDCDSEHQSSVFTNVSLRKGFFGKNILITPSQIDADAYDKSDEGIRRYREQEQDEDDFKSTLEDFCGAENAGGALVIMADNTDSENLDNLIKHIKIDSNINDKMFEYTDTKLFKNIAMAFENIPSGLLRSNDSQLFGNSGEALREMKLAYQENTTEHRKKLEAVIVKLMKRFKDFNLDLSITPLISQDDTNNEAGL